MVAMSRRRAQRPRIPSTNIYDSIQFLLRVNRRLLRCEIAQSGSGIAVSRARAVLASGPEY
jgi:hypothetical protein